MTERSLNRRDFLKLAGWTVVGSAVLGLVTDSDVSVNIKQVETSDSFDLERVETKESIFYLFFEKHNFRPKYADELLFVGVVPDVHFVESILVEEVETFQKETSLSEILYRESVGSGGDSYGPFVDPGSLIHFGKGGTLVAYEGVKNVGEEQTFVEETLNTTSKIVNGLALQSNLNFVIGEEYIIDFRNVIMARKLETLGKYYESKLNRKPTISASIGMLHKGGLLKIINGGFEQAVIELEKFSDEVLAKYVSKNGGIDRLCSTLVIDVKAVTADRKTERVLVKDDDLVNYLENRLRVVGLEVS